MRCGHWRHGDGEKVPSLYHEIRSHPMHKQDWELKRDERAILQ